MEYRKISELTNVVTGGTPSTAKNEYWDNGDIPWLQSGCCQNCFVDKADKYITKLGYDNSSTKMMPKDTIMIALTGATAGKVGYLNFEACGNQSITGILPSDNIYPKFLFYYLQSKRDKILSDCIGGAQPHISQGYVKDILVPFLSIDKQNELSETLDNISNIISGLNRKVNLLDELVKARFVEMFDNIGKKVTLSELCDVSGGYSFKSGDISDNNDGIKILQIGNVALNDVTWETTNYLPIEYKEKYCSFALKENDIVVALTRPIIQSLNNAKVCMVRDVDLPCLLNQRVGKISPKNNKKTNAKFIYSCLLTDKFTTYVKDSCTGGLQPNISTKDIEKYPIPDVDVNIQNEFVSFKEQIDKSKFIESLCNISSMRLFYITLTYHSIFHCCIYLRMS